MNTLTEQLIVKLEEKTKSGRLEWDETSELDVFQTSFQRSSATIGVYSFKNGARVELRIFNNNGEMTDRIDERELAASGEPLSTALREIYKTARRQALRADKTIEDILASLQ